jgi:acyl transferase domain-containing protein/acyl carrier protein
VERIAIIGIGCRFPGAPDPQAFWQLMCDGGDAITEVPADRFDINAFYHPRPATAGKIMSRWGGFLNHVDRFDAIFFGISPREAARMDPQHRLLLEVAWEAMEDAGQVPEKLAGELAGVFIGLITSDYWDRQFRHPVDLDVYSTTGSARSGAAGRISYALGLQGISVVVDAACSSSLVAVHLACQSLRAGSCSLALAGGVNIILNPDHTIGYSQGKLMAPDGRCKAFDAQANGYVRSEGAGVVVLKPLSRALADGDPIYAVIRGGAVNNDGHSDLFMTPSVKGQQAVLRLAYRDADISPGCIQYVETHGTGTSVGDPVELKALGSVLVEGRRVNSSCIIGSVKTNIGHTEGAAGLAGLIKVALCLKHKAIPPNLHFHEPNPTIPWQELPLTVAQELQPWPESDYPRLAGVSSFGIAGTNAHFVVEEAPSSTPQPGRDANEEAPLTLWTDTARIPCPTAHLLPLSAHTADALQDIARAYQSFMAAQNGCSYSFHNICYTASVRKTHHDHRLAVIGHSAEEISAKLAAFLHGEMGIDIVSGRKIGSPTNKIAWIFPGQGSQWLGMGRDLLEQAPVFRETLERCDLVMREFVDWSLLDQLQAEKAQSRLDEVAVVQPIIFAIQVALAALWRSWGIEPDAVAGHSMGEVAAAYVAGALSLQDAAWVICGRSSLLKRTSNQGAMAAVELSLEQAEIVISDYRDRVSISVSNSPNSTVLSGDPAALTEILTQLEQRGIFGRLVNVNVASHSPQMDALRDDLLNILAHIRPRPSSIPIYSTVTGEASNGAEFDAHYWVRNLREPVLFLNSVQQLLEDDFDIFMEMSPHPLLVGAIKQTMQHVRRTGTALASLRREDDGHAALLRALGGLYTHGYPIDWDKVYPAKGQHVTLPIYPWQRMRFWNPHLERSMIYSAQAYAGQRNYAIDNAIAVHPLLGSSLQSALQPGTYYWETTLDAKRLPFLNDHCINGIVVLPSTAYIEMALAAATEVFGSKQFFLEDMRLQKALFFSGDTPQKVQIILTPGKTRKASLQIFCSQPGASQQHTSWVLYASTIIRIGEIRPSMEAAQRIQPEQIQREWMHTASDTIHYQGLRRRGIEHGPLFQGITNIWQQHKEALAQITIPEALTADLPTYQFHPALLDICLQTIMSLLPESTEEDTYVPVSIRWVKLHQRPEADSQLWSYARITSQQGLNADSIQGDIFLTNEDGQVMLEVLGFGLQRLDGHSHQSTTNRLGRLLYTIRWEPAANIQQVPSSPLSNNISSMTQQRKHWLIFSEKDDAGQDLAERLEANGADCIIVHRSQAYKHVKEQHYEIDPTSRKDFRRLLDDAFDHHAHPCHGIVYLWGIDTQPVETACPHALETAQQAGCIAALHLIQAIMAAKWDTLPRLWFVTSGTQVVNETERIVSLSQSSLWGLGRVIVYEHPDLHCTLVDMEPTRSPEAIEALFKEVWSDDSADEVALRGDRRFVARLVHYPLPENLTQALEAAPNGEAPAERTAIGSQPPGNAAASDNPRLLFRSDSTYLITGGLGGIGLQVARWAVEQGTQHLILVGRSEASEAAEETLRALREKGAQIRVIKADIAQREQVASILAEIRQDMPALRGVFHSAVVLDDSILLQSSQERFLAVMRPKIHGAWNLHELTLDLPLDFFVLFSSAASLIGSPGQGNYAAANAFMDALAHYRRSMGYPALSINWGRWGEVGQATIGERGERLDFRGFASMKPRDGLTVLGKLLRQNIPQVGVMSFNLRKWLQFYPRLGKSSLFAHLIKEESGKQDGAHDTRNQHLTREMLLAIDTEQRRQVTGSYLSEQIASVLNLSSPKLDAHQQLNRLGIDSLMSVELKNRISSDLNVTVPVATFLRGVTLEQLTAQILQSF